MTEAMSNKSQAEGILFVTALIVGGGVLVWGVGFLSGLLLNLLP